MTLRSGLNPESGQSYEKIAEKLQKNLEVKKKCVPLQSQTIRTISRSVRITVSTQDSQSCNRGSIPLPTTKGQQKC